MVYHFRAYFLPFIFFTIVFIITDVSAATPDSAVFDQVMGKYQSSATGWEKSIKQHAYQLFWGLALISMVWTFGILALKKADISDFFVELIRFLGFTGFFLWLLDNGPQMAMAFIHSLKGIAGEAANVKGLEPVNILNTGLGFFEKIVDVTDFSLGSVSQALISIFIALLILLLFGLIAVNMMLLNIAGWILAYAGIFLLGFGGSRWTSDIAIAYYKNVLMVGIQLMVMLLVVGIGQGFLADLIGLMSAEVVMKELAIILIATLVLYNLANKVPVMVASIVTGHINTGHVGQAGTGALLASAVTAAAISNQAAQTAISSAHSIAGGSMAIQAAMKSTNGEHQSSSESSSLSAHSSRSSSNTLGSSLSGAMGDAVGSIGGAGVGSDRSQTENAQTSSTDQSSDVGKSSNTSQSKNNQGGESFGHAIARGIGEMAMDKIAQTKQNIRENTFGGRLATAIENPGALAQQRAMMNAVAKEKPDIQAEIAAFRDKKLKTG